MKLLLLMALMAAPASGSATYDCNGDWINPAHPMQPNPPCRQSAPEMSDWLAVGFLVAGGAVILVIRKKFI